MMAAMKNPEFESLKQELSQFRLDIITALCDLDAEIDALCKAIEEGTTVSPKRLSQLRLDSAIKLDRFAQFHSRRIGSLGGSPRSPDPPSKKVTREEPS
jgi:hypothetical protein